MGFNRCFKLLQNLFSKSNNNSDDSGELQTCPSGQFKLPPCNKCLCPGKSVSYQGKCIPETDCAKKRSDCVNPRAGQVKTTNCNGTPYKECVFPDCGKPRPDKKEDQE